MKNNIYLILFLFCQTVFGQFEIIPPNDFEGNEDFINTNKIENAIVTKYKFQIGFDALDSIQKKRFISHKSTLDFNLFGLLSKYSEIEYIDGDEYETKNKLYEYNSKNKIKSIISGEESKEVFEYDENSENITRYLYEFDFLKYKNITKYSIKNGLILNVKYFDDEGRNFGEENYKFNLKNDLIQENRYGVTTNIKTEYDQNNRIFKKTTINNFNKGNILNFKYNSQNKVSEIIHSNLKNVIKEKEILEYKNENLISKKIISYNNGKIYKTEITNYTFDIQNNWIEKRTYLNDIPNELIIREIKYK